MPKLGDINKGHEIGYKSNQKRIWQACETCSKERWVTLRVKSGMPVSLRCFKCARASQFGINHPLWKNGRKQHDYKEVKISHDDFFYPMAHKDGYVAEHRLIMAKFLNRCLLPWEIVHHKNGNKQDNRIENLHLFPTNRQHIPDTFLRKRIKQLEEENEKLKNRATKGDKALVA